jgi:hypothetical protein
MATRIRRGNDDKVEDIGRLLADLLWILWAASAHCFYNDEDDSQWDQKQNSDYQEFRPLEAEDTSE